MYSGSDIYAYPPVTSDLGGEGEIIHSLTDKDNKLEARAQVTGLEI